jgi:hypothetical protein
MALYTALSCVTKSAYVREYPLKTKSREASGPRPSVPLASSGPADETAAPTLLLWEAPAGAGPGYAWAGGELRRIPGAAFRVYEPLKEPVAFYRELARTPPTRDGVLAFANEYGELSPAREQLAPASTLGQWRRQIADLAECVKVWDLLRAGDLAGLRELFHWEGGRVHYRDPRHPAVGDPARTGGDPLVGGDLGRSAPDVEVVRGDVRTAALLMLRSYTAWALYKETGLTIGMTPRSRRVALVTQPYSLLGAAVLQLAEAVRDGREPRVCPSCGRWFDVAPAGARPGSAPGAARSDRTTCSTACRSKLYRARREEARRLRAAGRTLRQVAKELGSDVATVRGWVEGNKGD